MYSILTSVGTFQFKYTRNCCNLKLPIKSGEQKGWLNEVIQITRLSYFIRQAHFPADDFLCVVFTRAEPSLVIWLKYYKEMKERSANCKQGPNCVFCEKCEKLVDGDSVV